MIKPDFKPVTQGASNPVITLTSDGMPISNFHDNVWDFTAYINNKNVSKSRAIIDFNVKLANGTSLIEETNKTLLQGLKEFLYVRNNIPHPRSGKVLSPQTLIGKFFSLITLTNYVTSIGKNCFSEFTRNDVVPFIKFVKERNRKLASSTLTKYLSVIEDLFHFRKHLNIGLAAHPWPEHSVNYLSGDIKKGGLRFEKQTPSIPDDICASLFQQAIEYLQTNSERITKALTITEAELNKRYWKALKEGTDTNAIKTDRKDRKALYIASRTYGYKKYRDKTLAKYGFTNIRELTKSVGTARVCCYVVLALTTGMRNSELASLTNDSLYKSTGWDDEEYCWLKGYTYKLEDEPKPAKWMVPDVVELAINHLTKVGLVYNTDIIRAHNHISPKEAAHQDELLHHLFISFDFNTNLYNGISNSHWNTSLRKLAREFNLVVKTADNELNLPVGSIWPLASHQFRRTFACLAARSALGDIRYLREHYKHWSLDMTLHYAKTNEVDDTLFDEVLTERNELQMALVSDWITTDTPLTGGRGEAIATFRQRGQLKTSTNLKTLVSQISDSVFVRGTGHSWCLASGDGCGGEGLYDAIKCTSCDNAVIDKTHRQVWSSFKQQHEEILKLNDSGFSSKERARKFIDQSEPILKVIKVEGNLSQ